MNRVAVVASGPYVDALVRRDRDANLDGGLEQRLYVQQDANFNVTALVETDGDVAEQFVYDPYVVVTVLDPGWTVDAGGSDYAWVYLHQRSVLRNSSVLPCTNRT